MPRVPPHIAIAGVSKRFGDGETAVHAFGPASIEVGAGAFVSLLGPSGCGKSTLLLMIAGLLPLSEGSIHVAGAAVRGVRTDVGMMFQDNTLVPWRSVRGNVELQLELRGLPVAAYRERIDELLASVGLADFADTANPTNCRAACSSARHSARRSCTSRRPCCWMSRWASWTR